MNKFNPQKYLGAWLALGHAILMIGSFLIDFITTNGQQYKLFGFSLFIIDIPWGFILFMTMAESAPYKMWQILIIFLIVGSIYWLLIGQIICWLGNFFQKRKN